jgi:hypothetical protein
MTLSELTGYVCGHFISLTLSAGLAACLASSLKDYFSTPKRGFIDETMAGACNGLQMACPKCKEVSCWDPFPGVEEQEQKQQITAK